MFKKISQNFFKSPLNLTGFSPQLMACVLIGMANSVDPDQAAPGGIV